MRTAVAWTVALIVNTIASIGNAYADEVLFAARLHPKTFCNRLAPEEAERLYPAIVEVIT